MRVEVLGTLRGEAAGVGVLPSASKPRQILALLALNAQHIVPVPVLMEELWGAGPPRSAPTTLQTYILQLRRRLRSAIPGITGVWDKNVLVTRHGGYLLDVEPADVDALEFDRLAAAGHTAFELGDMAQASGNLTAALGLWRGPALADVPHGRHLGIEVTRLEESRLGALERRICADLRLGRHREVIAELCALCERHPLHEGLRSLQMLAYCADGRSSDALIAYKRLRETLVEELGLEPSPRTQRLHRAILRGEEAIDAWSGSGRPDGVDGVLTG
ncbi:BTAD domain-containing putative transcriptional regulator [Streptomyces sp. NPDC002889]|uniref:AfsR/SARP family transcriptional regulator n=1 Tax=Streptomyces sp. NPDC002889 TaxID=3364669 RepID=UPI0036949AC9